MLKQLIQSSQVPSLKDKIKKEGILAKLNKFSDCSNFRYERELMSLQLALAGETHKCEPTVMKALVKHMNTPKIPNKNL